MACLTQDKLCDFQKHSASAFSMAAQNMLHCGGHGASSRRSVDTQAIFSALLPGEPRHQKEMQPLTCMMSHLGLGVGAKPCCSFYFLFMGKINSAVFEYLQLMHNGKKR